MQKKKFFVTDTDSQHTLTHRQTHLKVASRNKKWITREKYRCGIPKRRSKLRGYRAQRSNRGKRGFCMQIGERNNSRYGLRGKNITMPEHYGTLRYTPVTITLILGHSFLCFSCCVLFFTHLWYLGIFVTNLLLLFRGKDCYVFISFLSAVLVLHCMCVPFFVFCTRGSGQWFWGVHRDFCHVFVEIPLWRSLEILLILIKFWGYT